MPGFLRQSTASQSVIIGPFLDDTDFKTAETGLTIANTDIKLMAAGGASANKNSGGGTHRVNGMYSITLDATDTATLGLLDVSVVVSGALPVFDRFRVLPAGVFDALMSGTDYLPVDAYAPTWNTTATPGYLTVYKPDGTTVARTKVIDSDPTAQFIVGAG